MRRLWLKWLALLVFVAVLGTAFVLLGRWQLDRLDERRATNALIVAAEEAPVRPYQEIFTDSMSDDDEWQRAEVTGTYEPTQFVVRYRSHNDRRGIEILTPLRTTSGDLLLVDRGFLPDGQRDMTGAEAPDPPQGEVTLVGHVHRDENGPDNATIPDSEHRTRLISSAKIAESLGEPMLDGYLSVTESSPEQAGELQPIPLPELSDGPHFWYAMQWFLFGIIALVGVVIFIRSDLINKKTEDRSEDDENVDTPAAANDART